LQLAELEAQKGNYRAAENHYNELLTLAQGSPSTFDHAALRGLARIKEVRGSADARAFWDKTEQLLKGEVENGAFGHRRELARLLLERGNPADVAEALKQARLESKLRQDWETLTVLAWAQSEAGKAKEARQTIGKVMASGMQNAEVFYRAAQIERALGNSTRAEEYRQKALLVNPKWEGKTREWYSVNQH
jgi:tetratricopeptide (TPR) repeat protein